MEQVAGLGCLGMQYLLVVVHGWLDQAEKAMGQLCAVEAMVRLMFG